MKNTMMIRSLMLAGLVLGSSMAQANWGKVVAKAAQKSFLSQHKGVIALTAGVVGLGALLATSIYKYKNSTDATFKDLKGIKGFGSYMWTNTKHYTNATKDGVVNATFATGRGIKDASCWIGRTAKAGARKTVKVVSLGKWCNDDMASAAPSTPATPTTAAPVAASGSGH